MMSSSPIRHDPQLPAIPSSEQGYVLLIAVFLTAILVLSLAIAVPEMARSIQRDRDLETWHRGMQYRRAIQLYYRTFHAYPPNADALVNTNNVRFLRKKYIDPETGKDDWKPILFGQNKVPMAMGFFGQPLAGGVTTIAGIGPSGGSGMPGASGTTGSGSDFGSSFGGSSTGSGSIFGPSGTDNDQGSSSGTPGSTTSPTDNSGGSASSLGSSGSGTSTSGFGSSSSSSSASGSTGQTFGGAGIVGFEPASPKQSILVYKKKDHYNEWEFTYDPISDMQQMGGGNTGLIGQPASGTSTPVGSPAFGNPGLGGLGPGGNGFGSSPNPTPPQMPPDTPAPQ